MTSILSIVKEQIEYADIALEALVDDVMEPDKQNLVINRDIDNGEYTVKWSWRCYSNSKSFPVDENLSTSVKAYCFDLIIATRNL